jgi:alkylhydroperoxidase family enzyme
MEATMTDFTLHTPDSAPEGSRAALAAVTKAWGFTPTLHAILAESPVALVAYHTLFGMIGRTTLTPQEQQVTFLTMTVLSGCEYCTMGHTWLARSVSLPEGEIAALRDGRLPADARLAALSRFTGQVIESRGFAGDAAVQAFLDAGFTRANVLEVVTVIATKVISTYTNHLAHTPKEAFMSDPAFAWTAPRRVA